jgi:Fe-Mn family superoxide dismutase
MSAHYPFVLPPLPYPYDALVPQLDRVTMQVHHDRLFCDYVDKLNRTLAPWPQFHDWPLTELLLRWPELPPQLQMPIRQSGGGVYNHTLYFQSMTGAPCPPSPRLRSALVRTFGSMPDFLTALKNAALAQFGSGYAWLCADKEGALFVSRTANQDTPLPLFPLLALDVWEHAYFLSYQQRRSDYVNCFESLIDWQGVSRRYEVLLANRPPWPME